jgi:SNF2 family DNA or RNA helicase
MELMPHQKVAVEYVRDKPAMLLAYALGTGKSAIAVSVLREEFETHKRKSVIICPAYLVANWVKECELWWPGVTVSVEGTKNRAADSAATVIISSYDRQEKVQGHIRVRRVVVYDEAHYLCGKESARSKLTMSMMKDYKMFRMLLMTGTPMKNRIPDLYNLFYLLDCVWEHGFRRGFATRNRFSDTFCLSDEMRIPGKSFTIRRYYGSKNLDYLRPWLARYWMKCRLEDVITLPGIEMSEVAVSGVDAKLEALLAQAWEMQENGVMPMADHEFGEAVGESVSTAKKNAALAKVEATAEFVSGLLENDEGPVLVFSDHVDAATGIAKVLAAKKWKAVSIVGGTPMAKRQNYVDAFQRGELDVLVGSIGACNTGITLTRSARCVFNDLAWVPSSNEQAIGRIYRISQTRHCMVFTMTGGRVDQMIAKLLREKIRVAKELDS